MSDFKSLIGKLVDRGSLDEKEAEQAFEAIMSGAATQAQMAGFLIALRMRGETVIELTAGARIMRERALKVSAPANAIDIVGTGGDGAATWNVSTATALVTAASGVPVAKHGNRAASSRSGTADALKELGVNLEIEPDMIARCIRDAGIGFMFAPAHHLAMKHVAPVRAELGVRTIFNLLGPLSNPAHVKHHMIGVYSKQWLEPFAQVLKNLGSEAAWIVHGSDGLDELTTTGPSSVAELKDGRIRLFDVEPKDAGLTRANPADLKGGDPAQNAAAIRELLDGKRNAYRDIVLLNTAAALIVAGKAATLKDGAAIAAKAIDSGVARKRLESLVNISNIRKAAANG